jgi:hypothetical protein
MLEIILISYSRINDFLKKKYFTQTTCRDRRNIDLFTLVSLHDYFLQLQLQSGYLATSANKHLTKNYIYTRAQQSHKV